MLTIICYVAVRFLDPVTRREIYRVPMENRGKILDDVPAAVRKDKMFGWLLADGSIRIIDEKDKKVKAQLENDPMNEITPEGKSKTAAKLNEAEETEDTAKKTAAEDAPEGKVEEKPAKSARGKKKEEE